MQWIFKIQKIVNCRKFVIAYSGCFIILLWKIFSYEIIIQKNIETLRMNYVRVLYKIERLVTYK